MIDLRKLSFILAVVGIAVLLSMLDVGSREIKGVDDLDNFEINQKVSLRGEIEDVRDFGSFKIFKVDGIDVVLKLSGSARDFRIGKIVEIRGLVNEYNGKRQIDVLKIKGVN